jgi:hypothetical protein
MLILIQEVQADVNQRQKYKVGDHPIEIAQEIHAGFLSLGNQASVDAPAGSQISIIDGKHHDSVAANIIWLQDRVHAFNSASAQHS